jgi:hypothetical protein
MLRMSQNATGAAGYNGPGMGRGGSSASFPCFVPWGVGGLEPGKVPTCGLHDGLREWRLGWATGTWHEKKRSGGFGRLAHRRRSGNPQAIGAMEEYLATQMAGAHERPGASLPNRAIAFGTSSLERSLPCGSSPPLDLHLCHLTTPRGGHAPPEARQGALGPFPGPFSPAAPVAPLRHSEHGHFSTDCLWRHTLPSRPTGSPRPNWACSFRPDAEPGFLEDLMSHQ